jgi:hypothetical protein
MEVIPPKESWWIQKCFCGLADCGKRYRTAPEKELDDRDVKYWLRSLFVHPSLIYLNWTCLKGEFFMADASEIAKALTAASIRTGVPSKSATEAVEFYRSIYGELIDEPERLAGESLRVW